jgi:hypothetical protein
VTSSETTNSTEPSPITLVCGKAGVSSCGTRIGPDGTVCRVLGLARENICALEFLEGYIVSGCWELKRKFRIELSQTSQLARFFLEELSLPAVFAV